MITMIIIMVMKLSIRIVMITITLIPQNWYHMATTSLSLASFTALGCVVSRGGCIASHRAALSCYMMSYHVVACYVVLHHVALQLTLLSCWLVPYCGLYLSKLLFFPNARESHRFSRFVFPLVLLFPRFVFPSCCSLVLFFPRVVPSFCFSLVLFPRFVFPQRKGIPQIL